MKNFNIFRWLVTIILFVILYLLSGSVLYYLLTEDFKLFNFGSEMRYGIATLILTLRPSEIFANPGWEGLAILVGSSAFIFVIIIFYFSYWITGKIFRDKNIQFK